MSPIAPQRRGSAVGDLLDSDFLGLHLESLLVRQPSSSQNKIEHKSHSILASPFNSQRRGSKDTTASVKSTSRVQRHHKQDTRSISSSSRASSSLLSPIDGVFESFFVPETASSTSSGAFVPGRVGSDGHDYFERTNHSNRHGSETPATSLSCTSMSTNFGKKRPANNTRTLSSSTSSNGSDLSFISCQDSSQVDIQLDRRPSDGTDETGITTPPAVSEGACTQEKEWMGEEVAKVFPTTNEVDDEEQHPKQDLPQEEASSDQTTWARFKQGGVIEPPEAEGQAPSAASWVKTTAPPSTTQTQSRYTSMMSARPKSSCPSPGSETIKAQGSMKEASKQQVNKVTLVPFGDDGRSFRFTTTTSERPLFAQPSFTTNHFSTATAASSSTKTSKLEPLQSGPSPKQQADADLFSQQQQQRTIRISGRPRATLPF